jgi:hypothetical protein
MTWDRYSHLEKTETFVERDERKKHENDPERGIKGIPALDIQDEYFDNSSDIPQLQAESGKFIDGLPWDKFFQAKDMGEKIVGAYRQYLFTKDKVMPCEVINIGGEDYHLKDYGLDNCFSGSVDILIPWLCIQKKITKDDLRFQRAWEDG